MRFLSFVALSFASFTALAQADFQKNFSVNSLWLKMVPLLPLTQVRIN